MLTLLRLLSALVALALVWLVGARVVRRYWHAPTPWFFVLFLNNPLRRLLQPPAQVVGWLDLREGMHVLELGPGPGTFTFEAARQVGPSGHVHAADIAPELVLKLCQQAIRRGVHHMTVHMATAYDLPVADASMDRVFMVTVLGEIPDKQRALRECRRVLKPGGLLGIGEFVPDPDFPLPASVKRWCTEVGFELIAEHRALLHYLLVFRKV